MLAPANHKLIHRHCRLCPPIGMHMCIHWHIYAFIHAYIHTRSDVSTPQLLCCSPRVRSHPPCIGAPPSSSTATATITTSSTSTSTSIRIKGMRIPTRTLHGSLCRLPPLPSHQQVRCLWAQRQPTSHAPVTTNTALTTSPVIVRVMTRGRAVMIVIVVTKPSAMVVATATLALHENPRIVRTGAPVRAWQIHMHTHTQEASTHTRRYSLPPDHRGRRKRETEGRAKPVPRRQQRTRRRRTRGTRGRR